MLLLIQMSVCERARESTNCKVDAECIVLSKVQSVSTKLLRLPAIEGAVHFVRV